jgi:hypothetical protein
MKTLVDVLLGWLARGEERAARAIPDVTGLSQQLLAGEIDEVFFLESAHNSIGHEGPREWQEIVDLDDRYATGGNPVVANWFRSSAEAAPLRDWVRSAAQAILDEAEMAPYPRIDPKGPSV